MHDARSGSSLTSRHISIGRLSIDIAIDGQWLAHGGERVESVRDAFYVLAIPMRGRARFSQNGRNGIARSGEYVLLSQLAFYELAAEAQSDVLIVRIPALELRGRLVSVEDHIGRRFEANEHMARLLIGLIHGVVELFVDRAPPNPQALATEIVSFIALTIASEDRGAALDVRNARYHLRRRIFDFIENHLSDQNLSPKAIAASSRISLSYLYSLFNDDETTVGQFIQVKRLQRAYELLVSDPKGHRTVSEIAYEVGFKNVSHFSRTFSRHFSAAPRDVRQMNNASALRARPASAAGESATRTGRAAPARTFVAPYWDEKKHQRLHEAT